MRDTNYMELFNRRMEREPLSVQEMCSLLSDCGLEPHAPDPSWSSFCSDFNLLLELLGSGHYDPETRIWSPSSKHFFAFDAEVIDVETMYLNYLKGLQSISQGELSFTDMVQDTTKVNWEEPSGTIAVSFRLNGIECRYDAAFQGDWLDTHIRNAINSCLDRLGIEKRFYATDASQGETLFFCTEAWARKFEEATLCFMSDCTL